MIGIYQIKNIANGKIYIGSSICIEKRWFKHKALLRHNKHDNPHLQNSWNKYGENSFVWTVLIECCEDILLDYEQWYIDILKPEYNISLTVQGGPLEKETKEKLSKATLDNYKSGKQPKTTKIIYQYDFEGNFVREWSSVKEAASSLGLLANKISSCLNFRARHTKRTRWSLVKYDKLDVPLKGNGWYDTKPKKKKHHYYVKLTDEFDKIYLFDTAHDAADYFNCTHHQIEKPLSRHSKVLKKYTIEKLNIYE